MGLPVSLTGMPRFVVGRGFAEAGPDRVTILTDRCVSPEDVDKGAAQNMTGIGRAVLNVDSTVGAAYARLQFTIGSGTGVAILDAYLSTSTQ